MATNQMPPIGSGPHLTVPEVAANNLYQLLQFLYIHMHVTPKTIVENCEKMLIDIKQKHESDK